MRAPAPMITGPRTTECSIDRAGLDDDLAFDARLGVDRPVDAPLDRVEDQPVGLEHVLELAGVLPPALDDVRPDLEAAIDQVLDGVGDLELVAEARA